jgi:8-oxo-dGTP diphosphatase
MTNQRDLSRGDSQRADFRPAELMARKNNFNGYRFCPWCAAELARRELDGRTRLICDTPNCDFVFYHNPIPGSGAIIYTEQGVLLVKRAHPPRVGFWCLPAGYMEWDESPKEAAIRETQEETGLIIEIDGLFDVYSGDDDPRTNAILTLYEAHIVGGQLEAGDDAMDAAFFTFENIPDNIAFVAHVLAIEELQKRVEAGVSTFSGSNIRKPGNSREQSG